VRSFSFPICRDTVFYSVACRIWRLLSSSIQQVSSKRESPSVLRTLVEIKFPSLLKVVVFYQHLQHRILLRNCPFWSFYLRTSRCSKNSFSLFCISGLNRIIYRYLTETCSANSSWEHIIVCSRLASNWKCLATSWMPSDTTKQFSAIFCLWLRIDFRPISLFLRMKMLFSTRIILRVVFWVVVPWSPGVIAHSNSIYRPIQSRVLFNGDSPFQGPDSFSVGSRELVVVISRHIFPSDLLIPISHRLQAKRWHSLKAKHLWIPSFSILHSLVIPSSARPSRRYVFAVGW